MKRKRSSSNVTAEEAGWGKHGRFVWDTAAGIELIEPGEGEIIDFFADMPVEPEGEPQPSVYERRLRGRRDATGED